MISRRDALKMGAGAAGICLAGGTAFPLRDKDQVLSQREDPNTSRPSVIDDLIVVGASDGSIYALADASGEERWRYSLSVERFPMISANERLVCVGAGPTMTALDTASGQVLWHFSSGMDRIYQHLVVADDVVYLSISSHLYTIASRSGEELWPHALHNSNMTVAPSFEAANGTIYIRDSVDSRGHLAAFANLTPARLAQGVTVRSAPSTSGIQHGTAESGAKISSPGERVKSDGEVWFRVSIGTLNGWIPLEAIDPATLFLKARSNTCTSRNRDQQGVFPC